VILTGIEYSFRAAFAILFLFLFAQNVVYETGFSTFSNVIVLNFCSTCTQQKKQSQPAHVASYVVQQQSVQTMYVSAPIPAQHDSPPAYSPTDGEQAMPTKYLYEK
jgi:hypothetical protein